MFAVVRRVRHGRGGPGARLRAAAEPAGGRVSSWRTWPRCGPSRWSQTLHQMAVPVFVIFFAMAGRGAPRGAFAALWPLVLAVAVARGSGRSSSGARAGARLGGAEPVVVDAMCWTGLVSQAGVALGLATIVAERLPGLGWPCRPDRRGHRRSTNRSGRCCSAEDSIGRARSWRADRPLRLPRPIVRIAVPQTGHDVRRSWRADERSPDGRWLGRVASEVPRGWVGWMGGEDRVDLRTSQPLTSRAISVYYRAARLGRPNAAEDSGRMAWRANRFALSRLSHLTQVSGRLVWRAVGKSGFADIQRSLTSDVS